MQEAKRTKNWQIKWPCFVQTGTYKVRNETNEINKNETKRNQRKQNEIDWYEENGRKKIKDNEIK